MKRYFSQYTRDDWKTLGMLIFIVALVLFLPAVWFYDYLTSYIGYWEWLKLRFFLTETLQNWWIWALDKLHNL